MNSISCAILLLLALTCMVTQSAIIIRSINKNDQQSIAGSTVILACELTDANANAGQLNWRRVEGVSKRKRKKGIVKYIQFILTIKFYH